MVTWMKKKKELTKEDTQRIFDNALEEFNKPENIEKRRQQRVKELQEFNRIKDRSFTI